MKSGRSPCPPGGRVLQTLERICKYLQQKGPKSFPLSKQNPQDWYLLMIHISHNVFFPTLTAARFFRHQVERLHHWGQELCGWQINIIAINIVIIGVFGVIGAIRILRSSTSSPSTINIVNIGVLGIISAMRIMTRPRTV